MSQQFQINPILQHLSNADSDFRFMALNDLSSLVSSSSNTITSDSGSTSRLIDGVVKALDDSNGEVQNLAVKCLAPLSLKLKDLQLRDLFERLTNLIGTSPDPSIPATALRLVIASLSRYGATAQGTGSASTVGAAQTSIHFIIPKLITILTSGPSKSGSQQGISVDIVDVLIEILRSFGDTIDPADLEKLQPAVLGLIEHEKCSSVVKKRAVNALASLCVYASDGLLSNTVSHLIMAFRVSHITPHMQRLLVSITGALSRSTPKRFGPYLKTLAPFVISLADGHDLERDDDEPQTEQDEVREAALAALESFLAHCTAEMKSFTNEVIAAGLLFLKYDPNYVGDDEEDEEMGGTQADDDDEDDADALDDEEFEDEGGLSDDDDISWKVRRGAAKLLSTIISTRAEDLLKETLYREVAPLLVKRFSEREENVRLEVLATTTTLIRKTRDLAYSGSSSGQRIISIKKRRRGSDISMYEQEKSSMAPPDQPSASYALQKLSPQLAKSSARLLKNPSLNTKQTTVDLLSALITALPDPNDTLKTVLPSVVSIVAGTAGVSATPASAAASGSAAASSSSLRIESLKFLSTAFVEGGDEALRPSLVDIVNAVSGAAQDKFYKISSQALATVSELLTLLAAEIALEDVACFGTLFESIVSKIQQTDADLEVRERAIEAMGNLLTVTSGTTYLAKDSRSKAFVLLLERLRNETTRLTTVRAIEKLAQNAHPQDLQSDWVKDVISELGAQLRKANRALRGSSLVALRALVLNPGVQPTLTKETADELVSVLTPLLSSSDLHLCGPALQILSVLISSGVPLGPEIIQGIAGLGQSPLTGGPLEALLGLARSATAKGQGDEILKQYLNLGVSGNTAVVAKVIGSILATGADTKQSLSVSLASFVNEIQSSTDDKRRGLALMVLGEAGLNGHGEFSLGPDIFIKQLKSKSEDVPLAAATALGLAGVGNPQQFVPAIISEFEASGSAKEQYLLLHSYKEILQHSVQKPENISAFSADIWKHLFAAAKHDESKSIAAECVGRLAIIDPRTYIPELQQQLGDSDPAVRGVVISGLRYTLTDTTSSFDAQLYPVITELLVAMLKDPNLDNRKLALTALNSAAHSKPSLVKHNISSFLPLVYQETIIKPELIREVQMGPFKHKVDDGLELRKTAYDTLYAFIETSYARMNPSQIYDRIIAGLTDEHEVQIICNLMLGKLVVVGKEDIIKRLDGIAEKYKATLSIKAKENAVKQELEKMNELNRSILRTMLTIQTHVGASAHHEQGWVAHHEWVKQNHGGEMASLEKEEAKAAKGIGI
ncbi:hypothetical protein H072_7034 [Dactylellina haptotyla CBS 200.50]|uniref:TATA-binding protein interacting (TIP20) domain-containing protein n=1 Tax=Dactylellina haptotyla (strain CBS 200.50) TaxID=1284197 RepID=S8A8K1_DACHA|nr:hypothetical protein H072_7034 [Dactylellina haptotyla CBS 200.50]